MRKFTRRDFLKASGATVAGTSVALLLQRLSFIQALEAIDNPLEHYPNRDWEKIYRDIFRTDGSFSYLCAPNDTHNCLLRAYTKKGIITRIEASYAYGNVVDLYGNWASHRWEPRVCLKGISMVKRFYGDRRVKGVMVRKGFLEWARSGFPRDPGTGMAPPSVFQPRQV